MARFPNLRLVVEHVTTAEGVDFVMNGSDNIGATITPQHLLYNRNGTAAQNAARGMAGAEASVPLCPCAVPPSRPSPVAQPSSMAA